jgi:hypothetical protein
VSQEFVDPFDQRRIELRNLGRIGDWSFRRLLN